MSAFQTLRQAFVGNYFRGRTALITGASSGIGRDLSQALAALGAKVAIVARRRHLLEGLANEISTAAHAQPLVLEADVTKRKQCRDAVDRAIALFGHLDLLINSAGIMEMGPVESMGAASLKLMMNVNLFGTLHMMQAVIPSMRTAGVGNIVNIASLAGRRGMPPIGGYCASKLALVSLTEALRVELYGSGVKVALHNARRDRHADDAGPGGWRCAQRSATIPGDASAMGDLGGHHGGRPRADRG